MWHYVKPNETTRVPRRHIFLDTEAHRDRVPGGEEQRWAIAVACFRVARPDRPAHEHWSTWDDPEIMWKEIDQWCGASGRTILWTHNLGYDSRISEMFTVLPRHGWRLMAHNLVGKGTWLIWRKNRTTLTMCDSASVFPTTLGKVGTTLGLSKLPLPTEDSRCVGLYSRCWRDVEILRTGIVAYLEWLEHEDLGNWQLTGAGQSWAAFRHKFMDRRLLVHADTEALAAERRAMWTGRCEAYWHGEIGYQVVHEWDFTLAYARIAQQTAVPVRLLGPMPDDYPWRQILTSTATALLAEVRVTTRLPVVPASQDGRILWPVGTFTTTLWDVEIRAALDAGASVEVVHGWLYHKAPALRKWADWVVDQLARVERGEGTWHYLVLKHWARALIGRFAMTYTRWDEWAHSPQSLVRAHDVYDRTTGETFRTVQIGQTMWRDAGMEEWSESMPMVTGYVQAVCRVRYWDLYRAAPPGSVLYGDTDSILVTDQHSAAIGEIAAAHPEWGLRLKRSWQGFAVWGPRQIRTGELVRVSGVPRSAARTDRHTFAGEVWETLPGALARGHAGQVVIRDRVWHIRGVDRRRAGPEIGWTHPIELKEDSDDREAEGPRDRQAVAHERRQPAPGQGRTGDRSGAADRRERGRRVRGLGAATVEPRHAASVEPRHGRGARAVEARA
jgi:hypothetical protein